MAIAACVFVNANRLVPMKVMALVAVKAGVNMQPVREYAFLRLRREFLKGVATEAGKLSNRLIT